MHVYEDENPLYIKREATYENLPETINEYEGAEQISQSDSSNRSLRYGRVKMKIYGYENPRSVKREATNETIPKLILISENRQNDCDEEGHESKSAEASACPSVSHASVDETNRLIYDTNTSDQIALCDDITLNDKEESYPGDANQPSSSENLQDINNYEQLGDSLDDHLYTTVVPPNMRAIHEEMKEEGVTPEEVLEISRIHSHNNNDDDYDNVEDPLTDYASGDASLLAKFSDKKYEK